MACACPFPACRLAVSPIAASLSKTGRKDGEDACPDLQTTNRDFLPPGATRMRTRRLSPRSWGRSNHAAGLSQRNRRRGRACRDGKAPPTQGLFTGYQKWGPAQRTGGFGCERMPVRKPGRSELCARTELPPPLGGALDMRDGNPADIAIDRACADARSLHPTAGFCPLRGEG